MTRTPFTTARLRRTAAVGAIAGAALLSASPVSAGPIQFPPPSYDIDFSCDEEGAFLLVEVIDEDTYRYDVYVDEELVIDFESDPDGTPWEFGPYPDGSDLFVEIYWYTSPESETAALLADGMQLLDCTPDDSVPVSEAPEEEGSGPTLPSTGGSNSTLVVTGLALLAAGGALLATRRRPRSA
ncbi:MAG TPA: hypothetical protein DCR14_13040 [Acidimicrobiaceae bacterium]|nr:hypothetical protein [Acidimicrobiaceae bacterium]